MFDGFTQLMALQELVFVFEVFGKTHLAVHKAKKKRKRSKENNMLRHTGNGWEHAWWNSLWILNHNESWRLSEPAQTKEWIEKMDWITARLSEARSRLYRSRFLEVNSIEYKLESSWRDLHDLHTFAPLRPRNFSKKYVQRFCYFKIVFQTMHCSIVMFVIFNCSCSIWWFSVGISRMFSENVKIEQY